jgi:hypothetical protein
MNNMCGKCGCQDHNNDCSCGESYHFRRLYQTKAEKTADLDGYLDELRNEIIAVEEEIASLKKAA